MQITTDEFRNLTQREQAGELYEWTLQYLRENHLEVNLANCLIAFNDFEETISDCSYLEERVLADLEVK